MTTGVPPSPAPKRSRARTLLPLGVAAWLVLEIWLLTVVANAAGGLVVLALLIGGVALGAVVIKRAGRRAFRNLTATFQQAQAAARTGAVPESPRAGADDRNGFLMLGGLLLMVPGLLSDAAGLLLLVPQVRSFLGRYAEKAVERRMSAGPPGSLQDAFQQARMRRPDGKVVQGEVIREDAPRGPRPSEGPRPPLTP
ncbi:FxsA family membrane protein [Streptomyces sp. NPDC058872]|uniref:FxsA family membrane protein n=1 Tax=Streptomyces sp. NPDC058872 TaxID=3346661 RepID=UPI0036BA5179